MKNNVRYFLLVISIFACTIAISQDDAIIDKLKSGSNLYGLDKFSVDDLYLTDYYTSKHNQIEHYYFQAQIDGVDVLNQIYTVILKEGKIVKVNPPAEKFKYRPGKDNIISPEKALSYAFEQIEGIIYKDDLSIVPNKDSKYSEHREFYTFGKSEYAAEDILVRKLYTTGEDDFLVLAWQVNIYMKDLKNWYDVYINATSGEFIKIENLVLKCNFDRDAFNSHNHNGHKCTADHNEGNKRISASPSTASYNVFDLYVESPNHGSRTTVTDPWLRAGNLNSLSDNGWHDDNGTTYTSTRGNNVDAYSDSDNSNAPTGGNSARAVSSTFDFDFPLDETQDQSVNKDAAVTNLFFWNNTIHDVMYAYGFDEVAGNFQSSNFGLGGAGGDDVQAEAQDGGDINNANFSTPADGDNPRMQMYVWSDYPALSSLEINSPVSISGDYDFVESGFSTANDLSVLGPITGDLVLVEDTDPTTHEACTTSPITNGAALSGKIAVIDRGNCTFVEKVSNVEALGAIAVIVVNNVVGAPITMGGTDNTITIPAVMVSMADGQIMKDELSSQIINVTMTSSNETISPDGDFDNGIIVHEYGHGISTRLTGGPSISSCLNNEEQMGEGWSDYFGLMLTTDWNNATGPESRGIGTYSVGEATDGTGIRTYPYSTDFSLNPFTYGDINSQSVPHGVGSVWATMLWEMTWEIIEMEAIDSDIYNTTGGNGIALQLVIDGLKLQPCSPGFIDGRDAILLADELYYNGRYKCAIWRAFARRGLGVSASQGNTDSNSDGVEAFDIKEGVEIIKTASEVEACEGSIIDYTLTLKCNCVNENDVMIVDTIPEGLLYVANSGGVYNDTTVTFDNISLMAGDSITVQFSTEIDTATFIGDLDILDEKFDSGASGWVSTQLSGAGSKSWDLSTTQANSGTTSFFIEDYNDEGDVVLTSPLITLTGNCYLSFFHSYEIEQDWDGGIVEILSDADPNWVDLKDHFLSNGYSGTSIGFSREMFMGNSGGFIESQVDLSSFSGNIRIRFRMLTDELVGDIGWYVDDIGIKQKSLIVNEAQVFVDDVLDNSDVASIEVVGTPDLTSIQIVESSSFLLSDASTMLVSLRNVGKGKTKDEFVFTVTKPSIFSGFSVVLLTDSTFSVSGTMYTSDVSDYTIVESATQFQFTSKPGVSLDVFDRLFLGFSVTRVGGSQGTITLSTNIPFGTGGGETPNTNNTSSIILSKNQ